MESQTLKLARDLGLDTARLKVMHVDEKAWFRVKLEGPFVEGQVSGGNMTYPGYEHVTWEAVVQKIEPERLFSFTWAHPKSFDRAEYSPDYSNDPKTLIEFTLEKTNGGTLLTLTESGFETIPADRRGELLRRNEGGWNEQLKNISNHVTQNP